MVLFTVFDYVICASMLLVSLSIGVYFAYYEKQKQSSFDILLGSGNQKTIPVALSLLASFVSSVTVLGIPAEVYTYGFHFWTVVLFFPVIMAITANLFLPIFYDLNIASIYKYLELRFDRRVRLLCSAMFFINMLFFMAVVLYAPSLALSQLTAIHRWTAILVMGSICVIYTTIGGIKAVIWTDVFQSVIIVSALIAITVIGVIDAGGFASIWSINKAFNRTEIFDLDPNPLKRTTVWTIGIGLSLNWLSVYATNQIMFQRYLSLGSLSKAKRSLWILLPIKMLVMSLTSFAGLLIFSKFFNCDPLSTRKVQSPDQLYPYYVINLFSDKPGFTGFLVAAVYSSALSTISSGINSMSSITLEDFVKIFVKNLNERKVAFYIKISAVTYGIITIILILIIEQMGNVLQAGIQVFGILASPILGLFILGIFVPFANKTGAFYGAIIGILVSLWVGVNAIIYKPYVPRQPVSVAACVELYTNVTGIIYNLKNFTETQNPQRLLLRNENIPAIYRISFLYFPVIGIFGTLIFGCFISVTPMFIKYLLPVLPKRIHQWFPEPENDEINPKLLSPIVRKMLQPKSVKQSTPATELHQQESQRNHNLMESKFQFP